MKSAKDLVIPFAWEERRPILLDRFFYIPACYDHQVEKVCFFKEDLPVVVEYCSGNGQWIVQRALQEKGVNWIAVEKKFERARKIWLRVQRENLSNVCVVCGEGLSFTRFYAPLMAEGFVNFPDPWPKRRHAGHRIVCAEFLEAVSGVMLAGGLLTCVTDDPVFAGQMRDEFTKCPVWRLQFHVNEWPDYGRSFFKDLWLEKGKTIHYLRYERGGA